MARRLRIVIVSYVDDNFGDNLIRISFQGLLEVALANHGLSTDDYEIAGMALKHVDEELVGGADAIFFAGGGLFGLSYLDFFRHVDRITAIADAKGIPVIFSSMGLNNMAADDGNADAIAEIVKRQCVKAVSVRENLALFRRLGGDLPFDVQQVADPAVWTKYVYGMTDVVPDGSLGINVVRGGLFVANDRKWGLTAEMQYLAGLREAAEAAEIRTQLYTNGSLDDNNTLRYFAREYEVPAEDLLLPQTTREVVEAIASRSAIASIRMHSSIIAYSFGIPTVALEWNDKLPHFYEAIGHPERAIPFGDWSAERSFAMLREAGTAPEDDPRYRDYAMSTYTYIHHAVGEHVLGDRSSGSAGLDFDAVADALVKRSPLVDEDEFDLRVKIQKAERAYLGRFITIRQNKETIGTQAKQTAILTRAVESLEKQKSDLKKQVKALEEKVQEQRRQLDGRLTVRVRRLAGRVRRSVRARMARSSSAGTTSGR